MAKKRRGGFRRAARRVRRRASVAIVRASRRARSNFASAKPDLVSPAVAVAAAAGLGVAEKRGIVLPTVGGFMPEVLYGVGLALLGTMVKPTSQGKVGKLVRGAATGVVSVGAYKLASGAAQLRSGEDDYAGYDDDNG